MSRVGCESVCSVCRGCDPPAGLCFLCTPSAGRERKEVVKSNLINTNKNIYLLKHYIIEKNLAKNRNNIYLF